MNASARKDGLALLGMAVLALAFFSPLLLTGRLPHNNDHGDLNLPLFHWLADRYGSGQEARWNQALGGGEPVLDELISAQTYPPMRVLLSVLPGPDAYVWHLWTHFLLGALGAYCLARRLGASVQGSFLAGLTAGFGGPFMFALPWFTVLVSLAWAPWCLLGLDRCLEGGPRERLSGVALLGLSFGLGTSGGYPGMMAYLLLPLVCMALAWAFRRRREGGGWAAGSVAVALAGLLALLLALGPLLGVRRLAQESTRGQALSYAAAAEGSLSPAALAQAVAPHVLGRLSGDSFLGVSWRFGSYDPQGLALYGGLLGLVLLGLGLSKPWRWRWPLLAASAGILVYALGSHTPAYAYLIELPVLSHLRAPMKAVLLLWPLLAVAVALGWDHLRSPEGRWALGALGLVAGVLLVGWLMLTLGADALAQAGGGHIRSRILSSAIHRRPPDYYVGKFLRWLSEARAHLLFQGLLAAVGTLALAWGRRGGAHAWAMVVGLLFFDLHRNAWADVATLPREYYRQPSAGLAWLRARAREDPEPWRLLSWGRNTHILVNFPHGRTGRDLEDERVLLQLPPGNMASVFGLQQFNGYTPGILRRSEMLSYWARDDRPGVDMEGQNAELTRRRRLLDLGAVRYILSAEPLRIPGWTELGRPDGPRGPRLYRNEGALPMAFFASRTATVRSAEEALAALLDPADPRRAWERPALLEGADDWPLGPGELEWLERGDERWALRVRTGPSGGTLVLSRLHYPGLWKASVDGRPVPLSGVNAAFCALPVPPGGGLVELGLHQPEEALVKAAAGAALALALALLLLARRYPPLPVPRS